MVTNSTRNLEIEGSNLAAAYHLNKISDKKVNEKQIVI
jgi:hypothetical protein